MQPDDQGGSLRAECATTPSPRRPKFGNQFEPVEPLTADEIPFIPNESAASMIPKKSSQEIELRNVSEISEKLVTSTPKPRKFQMEVPPEIEAKRNNDNRWLRPINKSISIKVNKKSVTIYTVKVRIKNYIFVEFTPMISLDFFESSPTIPFKFKKEN